MSTETPTQATFDLDSSLMVEDNTRSYAGELCDACPGEAKVPAIWAVTYAASELSFCNHHYAKSKNKHADKPVAELIRR